MPRLLAALTTTLLACGCALPGPALAAKKTYFRVGNAADAAAVTTAGTVLMGGSTNVNDACKWLCARAAGGDFLVVRATGKPVGGTSAGLAVLTQFVYSALGSQGITSAEAGVLSSSRPRGSVY